MSGSIVQFRPTVGRNFEQLNVTTSVQVLTPSLFQDSAMSGGAQTAMLTLEGGNIRYTYNGTQPSSTVGHLLQDGGVLVLNGQNQMSNFRCYQSGSSGSVISITYEYE